MVGKFKTKYDFFFFAYQKSLVFVFFLFGVELIIIIRKLYQIEEPIQIESKVHAK